MFCDCQALDGAGRRMTQFLPLGESTPLSERGALTPFDYRGANEKGPAVPSVDLQGDICATYSCLDPACQSRLTPYMPNGTVVPLAVSGFHHGG